VAAANRADPRSGDCQKVLREAEGPLIVPALVVAEAGFLMERDLGSAAEARFLRSLAHPRVRVEQLGTSGSDEWPTWWSSTPTFHWARPTHASSHWPNG
jgi:hypothetical protein